MELFNNKENDLLKFKINSEGININNIEPRLILTTKENKNYLLIGEIQNDVCKFNIPQLNLYEKGEHGKIKFEIISEDLYFPVWEDEFEIKSKASIKIEEMISEIQQNTIKKPKISVTETKIENQPKIEKHEKSKIESILENKEPEKPKEKEIIKEETKVESKIKRFDSF